MVEKCALKCIVPFRVSFKPALARRSPVCIRFAFLECYGRFRLSESGAYTKSIILFLHRFADDIVQYVHVAHGVKRDCNVVREEALLKSEFFPQCKLAKGK